MNKDIIEFLQNDIPDEDFDDMWESQQQENDKEEYKPPAYVVNNGIARYSQLAQILAVYYHAKHSEPICDVFEPVTDIQQFTEAPVFHL